MRPKVKRTNPVYRIDGMVIVPGPGTALEIDDPHGDVYGLLELLDGSRTVEELETEFRSLFPRSELDVSTSVRDLDEAGVLVDASAASDLDAYHAERWKRNLGFFEACADLDRDMWTMQERIRDCKVALLGVGGIGSHVSLDLLGLGVQDLRIVDFDKVELSNLNRQILYSESDIGQPKVELAAQRLAGYYSHARIDAVERKLSSVEDIRSLVHDRDFVIAAIDRPKFKAALWVNEACVLARVPFIVGGVEIQRTLTYLVVPGQTGCTECWRSSSANDPFTLRLRAQMEARHGEASVGPDLAAFGPMVTTVTAMLLTEFVRYVTGIAPPISAGRLMTVHFDDLMVREAESWSRRPDCVICGDVPAAATTS